MIIYVSLLVSLVGLILYGISANPKGQEIGRLMFACGLLAFLLTTVPHLVAPVVARGR